MSSSGERAAILFANCAGGARGEKCLAGDLGQDLATRTKGERIVAIGLSEVVISTEPEGIVVPRCRGLGTAQELRADRPPLKDLELPLNDLREFERGFRQVFRSEAEHSFFLSHLNSPAHCHVRAKEKKWEGPTAPERIRLEIEAGRDVYQGTAILLYRSQQDLSCEGVQLRPAGLDPLSAASDDPMEYRGNRDTEPRSAIILRELELAGGLRVDLVFCQLETNTQDLRTGRRSEMEKRPGVGHRIRQIDKLCSHVDQHARPVILMGDFNARPGSKELDHLCRAYGFLQVLPEDTPRSRASKDTWGQQYAFGFPPVDRPDFEKPERPEREEEGPFWQHSHLKHGILVDHAFVRGFGSEEWNCRLKVIELRDEAPNSRASDHRPICLTIERAG